MSTQNLKMSNLFSHPQGMTVDVAGLHCGSIGRNCEEHTVCGVVVKHDVVLRVRRVVVDTSDGRHAHALAVYWVSGGLDRCRVGFLPKKLLQQSEAYEGKLLQVTELYKDHGTETAKKWNQRDRGVCLCALIESEQVYQAKRQKIRNSQESNNNNNKGNKNTTITTTIGGNDAKDDASSSSYSSDSSRDSNDHNVKGLFQLSAVLEASTEPSGVWNGSSSTDGNNNSDSE
jgi:hypothetical protein